MTRWGWGLWVLTIACSFGGFEAWAIHTGTPTLSQTIWAASAAFPLLPFLVGAFFGGLGVHLFWREKIQRDNIREFVEHVRRNLRDEKNPHDDQELDGRIRETSWRTSPETRCSRGAENPREKDRSCREQLQSDDTQASKLG